MSVRRALLDSAGRHDEHAHRADDYHQRRVDAIAAGETRPTTGERPAVVFHLVPANAFDGAATMGVPRDVDEYLPVLARGEGEVTFTADGACVHRTSYGVTGAYARVSRTGVVEVSSHAFFSGYQDEDRTRLSAKTFETAFVAGVREYLAFLEVQGVEPPVRVTLSLVNVSGVDFVHSAEGSPYLRENFGTDRVEPFGLTVPDYGVGSFEDLLAPLVDAVWNAAGFHGSRTTGKRRERLASADD